MPIRSSLRQFPVDGAAQPDIVLLHLVGPLGEIACSCIRTSLLDRIHGAQHIIWNDKAQEPLNQRPPANRFESEAHQETILSRHVVEVLEDSAVVFRPQPADTLE